MAVPREEPVPLSCNGLSPRIVCVGSVTYPRSQSLLDGLEHRYAEYGPAGAYPVKSVENLTCEPPFSDLMPKKERGKGELTMPNGTDAPGLT